MFACNVGDLGSIPGSGRSPGEGNGNPLQYSCLENPMDGGAWRATVHGVAKSRTRLNSYCVSFPAFNFFHLFVKFIFNWRIVALKVKKMSVTLSCPRPRGL